MFTIPTGIWIDSTVSQEASLGGTYTGKEPMGLLWSMIPVPGSKEHAV